MNAAPAARNGRAPAVKGWVSALLVPMLVLGLPIAQAAAPEQARVQKLREPAVVGRTLTEICTGAGYAAKQLTECAAAMSRHCEKLSIDPANPRCWQWFVDQQQLRRLDARKVLRVQPGRQERVERTRRRLETRPRVDPKPRDLIRPGNSTLPQRSDLQ